MKKIVKIAVVVLLITFEVILIRGCLSELSYQGEIGDLERTLRVALDISPIDQIRYKDVHYYDKYLEKGDEEYQAFAILHYSLSRWDSMLSEEKNVFETPMESSLLEFVLKKQSSGICEEVKIPEIDTGYYGVYSFNNKRLLTLEEIKKIEPENILEEFKDIFIFQYDTSEGYMYCFECHFSGL